MIVVNRAVFGRCAFATLVILVLAGCGESPADIASRERTRIAEKVGRLGEIIRAGALLNGRLIHRYADRLDKEKPKHRDLVAELRKEATTGGLAYGNLARRLSEVPERARTENEAHDVLDRLARIEAAADPAVFNGSLVDVLNVLASLSDGTLPPVAGAAREPAPKQGAGGYLVGNPSYGTWRQDSSGSSFWAWYGRYALFRDVFWGAGFYSQNRWYRDRSWSYYGDTGRHYYGSRADQRRWSDVGRRNPDVPRKTYRSTGSERRLSTYGRSDRRTPGKLTQRASSYSGYGASVRGAGSGSRVGK